MPNRLERESEHRQQATRTLYPDASEYANRWQAKYDAELAMLLDDNMPSWLAKMRARDYADEHANDE
jgi:hypothetical protein